MMHVPTAKMLSTLLLNLYEATRTPVVQEFQDRALAEIARIVPFDGSIWGIGTISPDRTVVKGAHVSNFGQEAVDILNREDARNIVGKALRAKPGVAHIFSSSEVFKDPQTEALWSELGGVKEVLCHGAIDDRAGLISFLAIARRSGGRSFTDDDARWIEVLAPHLEATLQICRVSELQQRKAYAGTLHTRSAVCDATGVLHVAEPGFASLLQEGWPRWQGPCLPQDLTALASSVGEQDLERGNITVSVSGVAHQRIIVVTRKMPVDFLTQQERIVAEAYAEGQSYKEVARLLGRSPATVRHHLRSVYAKLGVKDKGELAHTLFER